MEHKALSQITPQEARTLLSFMQDHILEPKKLNPDMTWEESCQMELLFDKIRTVLSCLADKEWRVLVATECNGICNILVDSADGLRGICYHMLKNQEVPDAN